MKKLVIFIIAVVVFTVSCTGNKSQQNNTIRINISSEPDSLDPWQSAAADTASIFRNVFDGLLLYSPEGTFVPGIAESYTVSQNKLIYTFKLAKDVVFHNGKKLTSKDVLYTYSSLAGLNGVKQVSARFKHVKTISAPDDYTFVVQLTEPDATFLSLTETAILPEGYTEQATHPVGAGPFKFVEYTPGQKIVLERFDEYYNKARMPKIQRVEVYIMTNEASVISALRSGQLDAAYFINGSDADTLKSSFSIYSSPQNMIQIFGFNNSVKPLNDIRVRQAINYAINKKDVIDGVFDGYATELYTNFSPVMKEYYNDDLDGLYKQDTEKAKMLLAQAGYPDGFKLTITVPANYEPHVNTAQILVSALANIGIKATIDSVEWATWLDRVYVRADYQSTVIAFDGKIDPDDILGRYVTSYPRNFVKYSNHDYDILMGNAAVETDQKKRADMYKQCEKILAEDVPCVFICDPNLIVAARKNLKGYTFYPVTFIDFSTMYYE